MVTRIGERTSTATTNPIRGRITLMVITTPSTTIMTVATGTIIDGMAAGMTVMVGAKEGKENEPFAR